MHVTLEAVTNLKSHHLCVVVALGSVLASACGSSSAGDSNTDGGAPSATAGASSSAGSSQAGSAGSAAGDTALPTAGSDQGGSVGIAGSGTAGGAGEAGSAQGGASGGTAGSAGAPGLDPANPPGQNFDLSRFTLQLPTDVAQPNVAIDQVKAADLVNYTSIYFYTDKTDGAMTFWCPDNGAHTGHTEYARTELRENAVGGDWQISATASLSATFKVTKLPKTKSVIIGQIHGNATDGTGEALKLEYGSDNKISAVFEKNATPSSEDPQPLGSYTLGQKLSYSISLANKVLTVKITDDKNQSKTASTSYTAASWTKDTYYFKLGDYNQENTGGSADGGRVLFYAFNVEHQ